MSTFDLLFSSEDGKAMGGYSSLAVVVIFNTVCMCVWEGGFRVRAGFYNLGVREGF